MINKNLKNIPEILEKLSKTSSINEKKKILEETKSKELEFIFESTYNIFKNYGIVKIDISDLKYNENKIIDDNWLANLKNLLYQLENREITGNEARNEIKKFINNSPKIWANLVLKILKKDLRIGASTSIINKVYSNLFLEDICMAAMKYDKKRITYPVYVDTKLDGIRCIVDINKEKLFSRNGKEFKNYPFIMKELKELNLHTNSRIDGEIIMGDFQNIMRTVSRKDEGVKLAKDAIYNIFDLIIMNKKFQERLYFLNKIKQKIKEKKLKHLKVVKGIKIENEKELLKFYAEQLKNNYEGIIIKNLDSFYEYKRSYAWMKMKSEKTEDLIIQSVKEGTGKYKNNLGALICILPKIGFVNVGSGFTDEERKKYWKKKNELLGEYVEVKYQEKTKDGSLRFPVFMRFRQDK